MPAGGGLRLSGSCQPSGDAVQGSGRQVGPPSLYASAVRQDLTRVLEQDDTVAEQAPALLRMARDYVRGVTVGSR
jgi:hypothetical protein